MAQDQIEGKNPVLEALKAGRPLSRIFISKDIEKHSSVADIISLARTSKVPVEFVEANVINTKSLTRSPQGVIALASARGYSDVYDLFAISKKRGEPAFYLILDGLEDPQNLGAIMRTADAAGVHGIVIPERRSVGLNQTVAKVSAGAVEYVAVARINNLNNAIRLMKDEGVKVVGVDAGGEKNYTEADLKFPVALVIGGEGKGISRLVRENCDEIVSIPMKGKISSLNASVAASVVMYEVLRQRLAG